MLGQSVREVAAWTFRAVELLLEVAPKLRREVHAEVVGFPKARVGVASLASFLLAACLLRNRGQRRAQGRRLFAVLVILWQIGADELLLILDPFQFLL